MIRSRAARVGRMFCLGGAALGALGLIGWITGVTSLTTFVPGQPPMMPNTALALLLLGMGGALGAGAGRVRQTLRLAAAGVVLGIGAGTLAEYVLDLDLGIDQLFIQSHGGPHPGRPSPPTALALVLAAAALLLLEYRPRARTRPSEWLALSCGLIAFTALLGQLFGAGELYRLAHQSVIGVAFPTGLSLLLATAGILLARPDAGIMRVASSPGPAGTLLRHLGLAVLLTPAVLGLLVTRLHAILGVEDPPLLVGSLAAAISVVGLFCLAVNAVFLERSHTALESIRARAQVLFEQASDGIFVADLEGRYTDVNGAGCRMLGYAREEILGKTIMDLIPPEEIERLGQHKDLLLEGATDVSEWRLRCKDGSYMPVEVSAKILADGRWQGFVRDIRERNRARDQLRESREHLDLALRGADLASWDWNIESGEVVFNARWAELRGFRPEEVRPHVDSWIDGVHPDDLPGVQAKLREHFAGRAAEYEAEHRVRTRSGEWLWILDRGKVFARDDAGRPIRMAGTELDITERKRLEEELRRSEAQASGIVSVSADAIISIDENQNIMLYNEGAEQIFGYSSAEALGAPIDLLIPERFRSVHRLHVEEFAADGSVARRMGERGTTIYGQRKSGDEFPADAAISRLEVGGKRILTVSLRDVTERHRIEAEHRLLAELGATLSSSLEYEDTLSHVARLMVRDHADLCIVDIREESGDVCRLSVASRDPSLAWVCDVLRGMVPDGKSPEIICSALQTQRPAYVPRLSPVLIASSPQGEEALQPLLGLGDASAMVVPLLSHEKVLGVITLLSFGSSRGHGTTELRLAKEVAGRAALALENARLYRAARRAIQARDDVLAVVAHDLRNPLAVILLRTSFLRRGEDPDRRAHSAELIEDAASRMNRLIQDLLDVSCMEAGKLSIEQRRVSAAQVMRDCVEGQDLLGATARLELRVDAPSDLPHVWADRDRLTQVLANLIGNAIKFTQPGGRITVGAASGEGEVVFRVADTGAGIAPENLSRLFDRFWQAGKAESAGKGLGLAIVKGIVEAHGGTVWVESALGRGSTFFFTIPKTPRDRGRRPYFASGRTLDAP